MRTWSIYALILLSLAITFGTAFFIYLAEADKTSDREKVVHTHKGIYYSNQLLNSLQSAQTAQRNFLVTEDSLYLESYHSSITEAEEHLNLLQKNMEQGNPELNALLVQDHLIPAVQNKKEELNNGLTLYGNKGRTATLDYIDISSREEQLAIISDIVNELVQVKEQQLIDQADQLQNSYNTYNLVAYLGLLLIAIVIATAFRFIYRQSQKNKKLVRQLQLQNRALSWRHEREAELSREKNRSINFAAHDLRSPLNAITSIADLAQQEKENLAPEHREYWHIVKEAAEQMNSLINDLLDVQRIEEGTTAEPDREQVNVAAVVKDIVSGFQRQADNKNITLDLEVGDPEMIYCLDRIMFSQIAENLISNAIKFSARGSSVFIQLKPGDNTFKLIVKDRGPGIKKSEMERLYIPYEKLSATPTGDEKSTGLGLPIVKNRVEALGGTINCDSTFGKGTTFTVNLPDMDS